MNTSAALKERVLAAAAATPSLTRRQGQRLAGFVVGVSIATALAVFEMAGGLAHSRDRPVAITVRLADGWALASAMLTWLVLGRGRSTLARSPPLLALATLATPVLLFLWTQVEGVYVESAACSAWTCLATGLAMAAAPLGSFLAVRRGIPLPRPSTLGGAAGAMCGGWAGVLLLLACPSTEARHVIAGHVAPLLLTIGAGAVVGRSVLK
jgi:hypothetical protein